MLVDEQGTLIAGHGRALAARELLGLELGELKLGGFDLALTGFGDLELGDLLADRTQGLTDPDDVPEAPEHPVSRTGDLAVPMLIAAIGYWAIGFAGGSSAEGASRATGRRPGLRCWRSGRCDSQRR